MDEPSYRPPIVLRNFRRLHMLFGGWHKAFLLNSRNRNGTVVSLLIVLVFVFVFVFDLLVILVVHLGISCTFSKVDAFAP